MTVYRPIITPSQAKAMAQRKGMLARHAQAASLVDHKRKGVRTIWLSKPPTEAERQQAHEVQIREALDEAVRLHDVEREEILREIEAENKAAKKREAAEIRRLKKEEERRIADDLRERRIEKIKAFERQGKTTMERIALEVANKYEHTGITFSDLFSNRRHRKCTIPKFECYWRSRVETTATLPLIGKFFGGRDHTSILHGIRRYERWQMIKKGLMQSYNQDKAIDLDMIILEPQTRPDIDSLILTGFEAMNEAAQ